MNAVSLKWREGEGWRKLSPQHLPQQADLVLYFGAAEVLEQADGPVRDLLEAHPNAVCAGCSTAGEIHGASVDDGGLCAALVHFESGGSRVRGEIVRAARVGGSRAAGVELARRLAAPDLRHVFVLSDGTEVDGSELAAGLCSALPPGVRASGGMAADGSSFHRTAAGQGALSPPRTLTGLGRDLGSGRIVAVGFYGSRLQVGCGSAGGWRPFGPKRLVTRAENNRLYELDDRPALALYKRYLGPRAAGLPATGLLFPLELLSHKTADQGVVRTIMGLDEAGQSLSFGGGMEQGRYVRLMKASSDDLVAGAEGAARSARAAGCERPLLALLVSCVGRKLVLGQRVEDEIEAVLNRFPSGVGAAGFYSFGEFCPSDTAPACDLHNETMTLTLLGEEIG